MTALAKLRGGAKAPISPLELKQQLALVQTIDEGQTIEDIAQRMRDAMILAGKSVAEANKFAEVACEAAATIGYFLDPNVTQGQRTDLTSQRDGKSQVTSQTASNYRKIARLSPEKRHRFYEEMREVQEIISKSGLLRFGKGQPANYSSETNEWFTPATYLQSVRDFFGEIDLDPASNAIANETVQAKEIYTANDNGLALPWNGRVFVNPPYGTDSGQSVAGQFCCKALEEHAAGNASEVIILVNSVHSQKWQAPLYDYAVCLVDHRIKFVNGDGGENENPTFQNIFIYLGPRKEDFAAIFSKFGYVMEKIT